MWNDFKIGEGEVGTSAIIVPSLSKKNLDFSENNVSYWVIYHVCGEHVLGGYVMKDTPEGQRTTEIKNLEIGDDFKSTKIMSYLLPKLFQSLTHNRFNQVINTIIQKAITRGKVEKAREIRNVLGL